MRDVVILFAGRFPSEKAAALFVDLNARSLVEAGRRVTVIAPRRLGRGSATAAPYAVHYVPTIDLSRVPIIWGVANFLSVLVFAKAALVWLLIQSNRDDLIISNDAWPLLVASVFRRTTLFEMHDFAKDTWMYRTLFSRVRAVLVTNEWKRDALVRQFGVPKEKIILERNAVDVAMFGTMKKDDARKQLVLDQGASIVMYTGHLYEWKGADTLARVATLLPNVQFIFVGGAAADVKKFREASGAPNVTIVGHVDHAMIPVWQAAADVLVLPNSGKEEISVHYTSPMKLFEYMASGRAIVASDLPSIREVLPADAGFFAEPDNETSFRDAIVQALSAGAGPATAARRVAEQYSWSARATRILNHFV